MGVAYLDQSEIAPVSGHWPIKRPARADLAFVVSSKKQRRVRCTILARVFPDSYQPRTSLSAPVLQRRLLSISWKSTQVKVHSEVRKFSCCDPSLRLHLYLLRVACVFSVSTATLTLALQRTCIIALCSCYCVICSRTNVNDIHYPPTHPALNSMLTKFNRLCNIMEIQSKVMSTELSQVRPAKKASPGSSDSDKGVDVSCEGRRKRHRRGKHRRKWKPYSRMTMEEKRALEEREAARALKREAELAGKPSAPWNTTQFIMEDHGSTEISIPQPRMSRTTSFESSDEYYESPEDEAFERGLSMEADFEMAYKQFASERLHSMSKTELVEEFLNLEQQYAAAKTELTQVHKQVDELESQNTKLQEEINRLTSVEKQHSDVELTSPST